MGKAIYFDRDGVINRLVINPLTGEYEPPHNPGQLVLFPWVIEALRDLQRAGFDFFLVSNQPDHAKGKVSLEEIHAVHQRLEQILTTEGIHFRDFYYCFHHPKGIKPGFSYDCECRKPKPYFLIQSAKKYRIDLSHSWMIGDRDTDIECGTAAGATTILIEEPCSEQYRGISKPDYIVKNLKEASDLILTMTSSGNKG